MIFPETVWTVLAEATLTGGEAGRVALGETCEKYRGPIDAVIRSRGVPAERVEDVRQDFFLSLMESGFFRRAEQGRGKFRTFLLNALRNFLVDDLRKQMAAKRGGGLQNLELTETSAELREDEMRFDLAWAESLFDSVLLSLGEEMTRRRGVDGWKALTGFLNGASQVMSYRELGEVLGMSEGGAKAEVSRMRSKFREKLRAEIMLTVDAPHEVDEELAYLREAMSRVWGGA